MDEKERERDVEAGHFKLKIIGEVLLPKKDYDFKHEDEVEWFDEEVLRGDSLILHSNEIGDELGEFKTISYVVYDCDDPLYSEGRLDPAPT